MTNEELEHGSFEIENRIRNLMWTISGDFSEIADDDAGELPF